jgi:HSP20 family protein
MSAKFDIRMSKKEDKKPNRTEDDFSLFPNVPAGNWLGDEEGQLSVDVRETDREIIIRSAIAGVQPEDLEVSVHNDMLTIRGQRRTEEEKQEGRWLVRECHWGAFSRSLILPSEVDADAIGAELKNGVLTIKLPKIKREKKIEVKER